MTWIYIHKRLYTVTLCRYIHCIYMYTVYVHMYTYMCYLSIWGLNMSYVYMYVCMYTSAYMCKNVYIFSVLPCIFNFCKFVFKVMCHEYTHTHTHTHTHTFPCRKISHFNLYPICEFYYHWFHYCRIFRSFLNFLLSEKTL